MVRFGLPRQNLADEVRQSTSHTVPFSNRMSGDADGVHISLTENVPSLVAISGSIRRYVKVDDALATSKHAINY